MLPWWSLGGCWYSLSFVIFILLLCAIIATSRIAWFFQASLYPGLRRISAIGFLEHRLRPGPKPLLSRSIHCIRCFLVDYTLPCNVCSDAFLYIVLVSFPDDPGESFYPFSPRCPCQVYCDAIPGRAPSKFEAISSLLLCPVSPNYPLCLLSLVCPSYGPFTFSIVPD